MYVCLFVVCFLFSHVLKSGLSWIWVDCLFVCTFVQCSTFMVRNNMWICVRLDFLLYTSTHLFITILYIRPVVFVVSCEIITPSQFVCSSLWFRLTMKTERDQIGCTHEQNPTAHKWIEFIFFPPSRSFLKHFEIKICTQWKSQLNNIRMKKDRQ